MRTPRRGSCWTSFSAPWHVTMRHSAAATPISAAPRSRSTASSIRPALWRSAHASPRSSWLLFPNTLGKSDTHLLRKLQKLAKRSEAKFHTELHKLRKTGASRRYLNGVGLPTLMLELGHESLATTQKYLSDVRKEEEIRKAVADADYVPKPQIVRASNG